MIHFFLLLTIPFFALAEKRFYLLDNKTFASESELVADPFLILRAKAEPRQGSHSFEEAFARLAAISESNPQTSDDLPEDGNAFIAIENASSLFDYTSPSFELKTNLDAMQIWWQISSDAEFKNIVANLDQIEPFNTKITLNTVSETFLNPGEIYFFRAKALNYGTASPWSDVHCFTVNKPSKANKIEFRKIGQKKYEISWEKDHSRQAEYLIFGSNSQDFVPSIYYDKHILAISSDKDFETIPTYNLIARTSSNRIEIDGSLAYYRIVAVDRGQLSVPSELIYVYDTDLLQIRDRLVALEDGCAKRICYESCNPFLSFTASVKNYSAHPYISEETWLKVRPHLLPDNHPIRHTLDKMFTKKRHSQTLQSLQESGFKTKGGPENHSKTIFCTHKNIKGYVAKIIPDEFNADEVTRLLSRIIGAHTVQEIIDKYDYRKMIKVPKKWLYVLPPEPSPPPEMIRKNFILIAEDMDIYSKEENYPIWKSFLMTPELLHAVYTVITEGGLNDSVYAFNIPFSKDGKIAFIDTEDHHKWPIPYFRLRKYLSNEMKIYWDQLTQ